MRVALYTPLRECASSVFRTARPRAPPRPIASHRTAPHRSNIIDSPSRYRGAQSHRTAQLQARVLATFDALDALQLAHATELAGERREQARLRDKLRGYDVALRAAEDERDSMREAVVQLIEKGAPRAQDPRVVERLTHSLPPPSPDLQLN